MKPHACPCGEDFQHDFRIRGYAVDVFDMTHVEWSEEQAASLVELLDAGGVFARQCHHGARWLAIYTDETMRLLGWT